MPRLKLRAADRKQLLNELHWTHKELVTLVERVYIVEQLHYASLTENVNGDVQEALQRALRQLGEDAKRVAEDAKAWGWPLDSTSDALATLQLRDSRLARPSSSN